MPLSESDAKALIVKRHPEWTEHQKRWRWLMDSLEGGERYRHADYFYDAFQAPTKPWYAFGWDNTTGEGIPFSYGMIVERNLIPTIGDMSNGGRNIYVSRLNRTPVPKLVDFVIKRYLSRIFGRQVTREPSILLDDWRVNVDGKSTNIGKWMRKTVGPMLLTLGQIDLVFGHPEMDEGVVVKTKADQRSLGLDRCVAGFILPENIVWWRLNRSGSEYVEVLVRERCDGGFHWRHWVRNESSAYDNDGKFLDQLSWTHTFGRVPIVRVFDDRKLRCSHVGQSRMEDAAEIQKSVYNRRSQLILGDTLRAHPILQGPEEFVNLEDKVQFASNGMLPKKRLTEGTGYEGFDFIDTPTTGAIETRVHIQDDLDELMSHSGLMKPAGSTSGSTVSQSGVSKSFDAREGNDLLSEIAITLQEAEVTASRMALIVLTDGSASDADLDAIDVEYPREYDLFSADDLAAVLADIQAIVTASGGLPATEAEVLKRLITILLPGLDEDRLAELHAEVDDAVTAKATSRDQEAEANDPSSYPNTVTPAISIPNDAEGIIGAINSQILNN